MENPPTESAEQLVLEPMHSAPTLRPPDQLRPAVGERMALAALIASAGRRASSSSVVADRSTRLTHLALHRRAGQLARHLVGRGVVAGDVVGVALERSVDAVVAMLAMWRLGAVYLPLDPALPAARIATMIASAGVRHVVTRDAMRDRLPELVDAVFLDRAAAAIAAEVADCEQWPVDASDAAYIVFTSGSTGAPKGVVVTHGNAAHYAHSIARVLTADDTDDARSALEKLADWSFAMVSTLAADLGYSALFPALCAGATLHLLDETSVTEPARFADYMATHDVDVLKITPSHLRALVGDLTGSELAAVLPSRWLILGGEALGFAFAERLLDARVCSILNHYGPTETTVGACAFEVTRGSIANARAEAAQTVPVGYPLPGVCAAVLDAQLRPVPLGALGELYVGGDGVARGYANDAALTTARFVAVDGCGRAYRTGDRVRQLTDGALEFLGRTDDQVKIRGYRVDLGEIEHALKEHPGVADAAVVMASDSSDERRLVAYVVPSPMHDAANGVSAVAALMETLGSRLPHYMIPENVVLLDALPLTPNGKVDRRALAGRVVDTSASDATVGYVAPRSETERTLVGIWSEVLRVDRIGVTDRFLELGGQSLLAIRILGKLSRAFGVRVPLRTMFEGATVQHLAAAVDAARAGSVSE